MRPGAPSMLAGLREGGLARLRMGGWHVDGMTRRPMKGRREGERVGAGRRILGALVLALALAGGLAPARAQTLADYDYTNLGFRGAGLAIGRIWPTKVASTQIYGVRVDLGYLGPGVRIAPTLSYWSSKMRPGELNKLASSINALPALQRNNVTLTGNDLGPIRWSDLALDVDGEWVVTMPSGMLAYAGAGVGLHVLNGSGGAIANTFIEDLLDTVAPALTGLAGLEYRLDDRFRLFGEIRATGMSDIQYAGFRVGGALMMPGRNSGGRP